MSWLRFGVPVTFIKANQDGLNHVGIVSILASIVFRLVNFYINVMTIEQKKISLINWITTLEDEVILDQMAGFKKSSMNELPDAVVQLLKMAEAEPDENLVKHTTAKDFLKMK